VVFAGGSYSLFAQNVAARGLDLAADWQAAFDGPQGTRVVFRIMKSGAGWRGAGYYIDQAMTRAISIPAVTLQGDQVKFFVNALNGSFAGELNPDRTAIEGKWTQASGNQGNSGNQGFATQPLTLTRATKGNTWPVPVFKAPPVMDAKLTPHFDVTTVKPHDPNVPGGGWQWQGARNFKATMPVAGLIEDIYGIHRNQLIGAPPWAFKDMYDYAGVPDQPGWPTKQQRYKMERELLEDRFQLKTHVEKRELPALALTIAKGGPKLTPSVNIDPGVTFSGRPGHAGGITLTGRDCAMSDLVRLLQQQLDQPVVDATGLDGVYDFDFDFMPDQMAASTNATQTDPPPPNLVNALQQELGLKLSPAKESVDVVVVDRLERPSPN
jgi:uncharacterized protein (TIGR03435 family)